MHPIDSLFYVLGRCCWITLGPNMFPIAPHFVPYALPNIALLQPIVGQMLGIVSMFGVITSTLWSLQSFRTFL
jgi:hypothetical protein